MKTETNQALVLHHHGKPSSAVSLETLPREAPGPAEALLRVLASPINPSDLGTLAGTYGELPPLPAVAGREGVAVVMETGRDVREIKPGDRVLLPGGCGCWRQWVTAEAAGMVRVPVSVPVSQAAMASINPPTARLLLDSFVGLHPGDWIVQNAANSAVGHYVAQLAKARGLRTVNLTRGREWIDRLRSLGADAVLLDEDDAVEAIRGLTGGRKPRLALNSIGGSSAIRLVKTLADGGTLVTFGGMTGEPVRFPTRYLIFHDIRLRGFWLRRWKLEASPEQRADLFDGLFEQMGTGSLHAPVEKEYPLTEYQAALEHAARSGRSGKILFRMAEA